MGPMLSTVSARMFVRFDQSDQIQHGYQCRGAACFQGSAMPPSQGNGTSAPHFLGHWHTPTNSNRILQGGQTTWG